jgi:acyl carrier protein
MGLDAVEIVIELERTFELKIPDADAVRLVTPALVIDYLAARVGTVPSDGCQTQQLFYRVRRGFQAAVPALAADLGLETRLADVLHKDQWPGVWAAIRAEAGTPDWPKHVRWRTWFGLGPATVRDLVAHLALETLRREPGAPWTREQIEWTVRRIIIETSGLESTFSLRKTFAQLGID